MTPAPTPRAREPIPVHFVASGLTIVVDASGSGVARVMEYGSELTITPELVQANTDRVGNCPLLDLLDDDEAQARRWGKVMVRRGPWPADLSRIERGSLQWDDAREAARQKAWKIDDPNDRARALAQVKEHYGPQPTTSRTIADYASKP